jgi:hypothetical protein
MTGSFSGPRAGQALVLAVSHLAAYGSVARLVGTHRVRGPPGIVSSKGDGLLIRQENQQVNGQRPGALQSAGDFVTCAARVR